MLDFLSVTFFGNTVLEYAIALGILLATVILFKFIKVAVIARVKALASKTETDVDDFIAGTLEKIGWWFFAAVGLYFGLRSLALPETADTVINALLLVVIVVQIVRVLERLTAYVLQKAIIKERDGVPPGGGAVVQLLRMMTSIAYWAMALILVLSNLGINVTSLITGLGISGIAVALATQSIIKDLFSAVTIHLDRPFEVGHFIILDADLMGTVEHIGIKSTRIRALSGQEIVLSNSYLLENPVNNYKRMQRRRVPFTIGITYDTPVEKIEKGVGAIKKIVEGTDGATLDRAHWKSWGDFNLGIEVVYYVETGDYNKYMDIQQHINIAIKRAFEELGIEFAFPTQTVYIKK